MPRKRKLPSLGDMCLQNIAENVIYHAHRYHNSVHNEKCIVQYHVFQCVFSDDLLEILCRFHSQRCKLTNRASSMLCPTDFLFRGGRWCGSKSLARYWDFIFNRHLQKVSLMCPSCTRRGIPAEIVSRILSNCQNPIYLNLSMCYYNEAHFLEAMPCWQNLVTLDLSHSQCTNQIVIGVWNTLAQLQSLYLDCCPNITNLCLFQLCKFCRENSEPPLCLKKGLCSTLGKNLKNLSINGTKITESGIMCGLLHLQSLEILNHNNLYGENSVPSAALIIGDSYIHRMKTNCQPSFHLRLKCIDMKCSKSLSRGRIRKILSLCPQLKELSLSASAKSLELFAKCPTRSIRSMALHFTCSRTFNSLMFRKFLLKKGEELLKLKVSVGIRSNLKIISIVEILKKCKNLRELSICGSLSARGANENVIAEIPASVQNLQILDLSGVVLVKEPHVAFFTEIMKKAVNLTSVMVSNSVAKKTLVQALERNSFNSLQKIVINDADVSNLSLAPFVNNENSLNKIILYICKNTDQFLNTHKEIAWKNDFFLDIVCQST